MLGSIRRPEEDEVFGVQDWAEVHRLDGQGVAKRTIARRLRMSPTTVHRLLGLAEPPRYERRRTTSLVDAFASEIAAMLDEDAKVPATVVLRHLRRSGYVGGITILKEHLARVRPQFLAARAFQRTTYLPGEISQIDWWHTGRNIPVGKGAHREAFGLVATLPHSAAHATVFTFGRTIGDLLPAAWVLHAAGRRAGQSGLRQRHRDRGQSTGRRGHPARRGGLVLRAARHQGRAASPGDPQAKGQVERTSGYLERSFLSLRTFSDLRDLQAQDDDWTAAVAFARHHRRVGAIVAEAWLAERAYLRALPDRCQRPRGRRRPGSAATASAASQVWTTRCRPALLDAASSCGPRRMRSWSSSRDDRSPGTVEATCRPTS
jgi:transposase